MLLVMDVGNSNIVMAVFRQKDMLKSWRITTDRAKTDDEYRVLVERFLAEINLSFADLKDVVISSVVPPINPSLDRLFKGVCAYNPLFINAGIKTGLNLKVEDPKSIGSDRIVNAVAAYERFGGPLIIFDLGTATTVCAISAKGDFLGGVISPGLGISVEALSKHAAKLPLIDIVPPDQAMGKNTVDSLHSGIFFGYVGLVEGFIKLFKKELNQDALVIATGGFATMIGKSTTLIDRIEPSLTLDGLRILHEKNYPR